MASSTSEFVVEIPGLVRVHKDGTVERLKGTAVVPASIDPETGVQSKDVVVSPETGVSARLYIPKTANPLHKLPLLVYFHGGAFIIEAASSPVYHNYLNALVAAANVVAVSVDYRRAPEHPVPIPHDDSWAALKWVASHSGSGAGEEPWLSDYVDFDRVFVAGDSAGGNIAHNMGIRVGSEGLKGTKVVGIILVHPYFLGKEPIGAEAEAAGASSKARAEGVWRLTSPSSSGFDDPLVNPVLDPKFATLGCTKVLVFVAEKDWLADRGVYYHEALGRSGWGGEREIVEQMGESHVFHLFSPTCDNATAMQTKTVSFLNQTTKAE